MTPAGVKKHFWESAKFWQATDRVWNCPKCLRAFPFCTRCSSFTWECIADAIEGVQLKKCLAIESDNLSRHKLAGRRWMPLKNAARVKGCKTKGAIAISVRCLGWNRVSNQPYCFKWSISIHQLTLWARIFRPEIERQRQFVIIKTEDRQTSTYKVELTFSK